jgi:hypothetical protein
MNLSDISETVVQKYPHALKFKNREYDLQIPLTEDVYLSINFKKYPNPPKVILVKKNGKIFKLSTILSHLRDWDENGPYPIVNVIDEVFLLIESIMNRLIPFTESCFQGLIQMCKEQHPNKVQGVLSVDKGKVSELIIPAIKCAETESRINYVNFQSMCVLPFDLSYEGTFISRPDGDLSKNPRLNQIFRRKRFTMLMAYPYDKPENIKLYDRDGKELKYVIYSD